MLLACCELSLSLRLSARHYYTLPGSCFKKNDKTLLHPFRWILSNLRFKELRRFRALPSCHHLVSDLFQSHTCGFFSAFARATCSLSVYIQYLGLEFNAPVFSPYTQTDLLIRNNSIALGLRGCHSLWPFFPERSAHALDDTLHHISASFARGDSVCPSLRSIALLAASLTLSSPAGTKLFQFPACAHGIAAV